MIRLFVALALPEDLRQRLAGLGGGVPGARWTEPENLHLTLRFIGDVPDDRLADIDAALAGVESPGFALVFDGVGVFGNARNARILWAGVERSEALNHLQGKIESALVRGGEPRDERRFTPHVTLARLKDAPRERIGRFIEERGLFRAGPVAFDRFTLFRSHLGRSGPVYEPLRDYTLG
ncbi:RNA 2',3'-cyclic phosphodiesterase [Azospirillum halopraeferens]|uniref:RNA 2',3'-cyclic phosphodiesterase n=1 Tax=Azospirillum halopraeferens TaxID=34010 RepID=UPI000420877C|nr:RNA 2',3'-cyclic phosphodiesterase [Azospirillum halopraeferens]